MRRINASQTNIDSLYSPLSELVRLVALGGRPLEQWHYVTAGTYAPNRRSAALTLQPQVTVTDPDTGRQYNAVLTGSLWYYRRHGDTGWTQITNTTESADAPFTKLSDCSLVIRANFTAELRCELVYADPRNGLPVNTTVYETIVTNEDADSVYNVHIITGAGGYEYSPLTEDSSLKTFIGKASLGTTDMTGEVLFQWYTQRNGSEVLIGTGDWEYVSGQGTPTLVLDALFADQYPVILRIRRSSDAENLEPCRDQAQMVWRIPKTDGETYSPQGAAVRGEAGGMMEFLPVYRTTNGNISDEKVRDNLRIKWSRRNSAGAFSEVGWGPNIIQREADLRTDGLTSTLMQSEAFLMGPYAQVVQGGKAVIQVVDGKEYCVVCRSIDT